MAVSTLQRIRARREARRARRLAASSTTQATKNQADEIPALQHLDPVALMADQETMPTRITFSKRLSDIQTANPSMGIDEAFALAMSDDPSTAPNLGASASTNAFSAVVKTKSDAQYACAVAALRNLPAKPGAPKPTYPDALARVANSVPAMSVQQATEVLQRALKADEAAAAAHMATVSSSTAHTMKTMTDSGSLNTAYQAGIEAAKR